MDFSEKDTEFLNVNEITHSNSKARIYRIILSEELIVQKKFKNLEDWKKEMSKIDILNSRLQMNDYEYVIRCLGYNQSQQSLFYENGLFSLQDYVNSIECFGNYFGKVQTKWPLFLFFVRSITNGIAVLHEQNISFGNLKLDNLILNIANDFIPRVKLIDFESIHYDKESKGIDCLSIKHSEEYKAPEISEKINDHKKTNFFIDTLIDPFKNDIFCLAKCCEKLMEAFKFNENQFEPEILKCFESFKKYIQNNILKQVESERISINEFKTFIDNIPFEQQNDFLIIEILLSFFQIHFENNEIMLMIGNENFLEQKIFYLKIFKCFIENLIAMFKYKAVYKILSQKAIFNLDLYFPSTNYNPAMVKRIFLLLFDLMKMKLRSIKRNKGYYQFILDLNLDLDCKLDRIKTMNEADCDFSYLKNTFILFIGKINEIKSYIKKNNLIKQELQKLPLFEDKNTFKYNISHYLSKRNYEKALGTLNKFVNSKLVDSLDIWHKIKSFIHIAFITSFYLNFKETCSEALNFIRDNIKKITDGNKLLICHLTSGLAKGFSKSRKEGLDTLMNAKNIFLHDKKVSIDKKAEMLSELGIFLLIIDYPERQMPYVDLRVDDLLRILKSSPCKKQSYDEALQYQLESRKFILKNKCYVSCADLRLAMIERRTAVFYLLREEYKKCNDYLNFSIIHCIIGYIKHKEFFLKHSFYWNPLKKVEHPKLIYLYTTAIKARLNELQGKYEIALKYIDRFAQYQRQIFGESYGFYIIHKYKAEILFKKGDYDNAKKCIEFTLENLKNKCNSREYSFGIKESEELKISINAQYKENLIKKFNLLFNIKYKK